MLVFVSICLLFVVWIAWPELYKTVGRVWNTKISSNIYIYYSVNINAISNFKNKNDYNMCRIYINIFFRSLLELWSEFKSLQNFTFTVSVIFWVEFSLSVHSKLHALLPTTISSISKLPLVLLILMLAIFKSRYFFLTLHPFDLSMNLNEHKIWGLKLSLNIVQTYFWY